jgi:hypothetical protein
MAYPCHGVANRKSADLFIFLIIFRYQTLNHEYRTNLFKPT